MSLKARKFWSIVVLLIGMPIWVIVAINIVALFEQRPPILLELLIFIVLGFVWILPFKKLFTGVAAKQPDDDDVNH